MEVSRVSSQIFQTTFSPTNGRTGAKILRKPLKGPTIANYYGNPDFLKFKDINNLLAGPGFSLVNEQEEYRLSINDSRRRRGKGAPQKKREAASKDPKSKKKK